MESMIWALVVIVIILTIWLIVLSLKILELKHRIIFLNNKLTDVTGQIINFIQEDGHPKQILEVLWIHYEKLKQWKEFDHKEKMEKEKY